ncbi:MAG: glutamate synthase large subunit [Bacteroidota bacterium]
MQESDQPRAVGQDSNGSLYTPQLEHDSCGIGFIAQLEGPASHQLISDALTMLKNMEHRGACGCDPLTGDGAGILIQIPHLFFRKRCLEAGFSLPEAGQYGVGMVFFPQDESLRQQCREALNDWIDRMGFNLLGYREVPNRPQGIGMDARLAQPWTEQVFVQPDPRWDKETFERKLYLLRRAASMDLPKQITNLAGHFYFTSFSAQTIVYKGQLRTDQVESFFPDLEEDEVVSRIAVIHSRFSTNTFPNWRLAQPFRYIAHNGEINTIRGNVNWMRSKEAVMTSEVFSREELEMLFPICDIKQSDSCNLDSIVELLVMSGRSLPHVMMMLIPEAWQEHEQMDPVRRDFYEYHASLTEPWDGPAAVCFTDGNIVGATLDRNGLRPARYTLTHDGRLVLASETGALPIDPALVKEHGRLQPGKILVADLAQGRIVSDQELKDEIANRKPYGEWLTNNRIFLKDLPIRSDSFPPLEQEASLLERQHMFGVSSEELSVILDPMSRDGKEPIGSMGADTPLAILSRHSQHISHYVKQLFAQVSNPPIDPIRERLVMSLHTWIGSSQNALQERPESCEHIRLEQPVLTNDDLRRIRSIQDPSYQVQTLPIAYSRGSSLQNAVRTLCASAEQAIADDFNVLILSDRSANDSLVPIPALLAIGAVHHALIRAGKRGHTALILETAEAREVHHFATLIGFGAVAVNPYLAFDCLRARSNEEEPFFQKENNYIKAVNKGLLKVFSKMGISTLQSYHGAQIFEIVGINHAVVDECFTGTVSRLEGLGFEDIAREVEMRHQLAYPSRGEASDNLDVGGLYQWKRNGEKHLLNPKTIHLMQRASRQNDYDIYKQYAHLINEAVDQPVSIRNLFTFKEGKSIPLSEVEPVENILSRFATGAMSFGSISWEAHTTLAIAMNRIGGKSNSGEGGEDESRYTPLENGDSMRSATKQVASGRFGVTSYYLSQADELQIKMAQGAKPGEGGQLPGHKVDAWIAKVRHSTPGVGLISPPPHHDIYSIEDLAQLIFDLKNANRKARISVKLVSEAGVGTIAAGVAKAHADHILISGQDGGTGASPLSSIRHAGLPWELGLAEAHQTLVRNNLRSRVRLQADGQIRTGRDLAIATLLGAEEWGVATAETTPTQPEARVHTGKRDSHLMVTAAKGFGENIVQARKGKEAEPEKDCKEKCCPETAENHIKTYTHSSIPQEIIQICDSP